MVIFYNWYFPGGYMKDRLFKKCLFKQFPIALGILITSVNLTFAASSIPSAMNQNKEFNKNQYLVKVAKYHKSFLGDRSLYNWPNGEFVNLPKNESKKYKLIENSAPKKILYPFQHLEIGKKLFEKKKFTKAEKAYLAALDMDPEFAKAHFSLAILYSKTKNYKKAEEEYIAALKFQPNMPQILNNLGVIYANQKQYVKAEKTFKKAIQNNKKDLKARLNLANLYFYLNNNLLKAKREYQAALKLNSNLKQAKINLETIDKELVRSRISEKRFEMNLEKDQNFIELTDSKKEDSNSKISQPKNKSDSILRKNDGNIKEPLF